MPHDPPRVLVVDDMPDIRELISINLRLEGFEVSTAGDGAECLEIVDEVAPDVITLDVAMKGLDGFSTAEELRQRQSTAGIRLVMVTALAQGYDLERGATIGVDAYLTKPFEPADLVRTVRRLVAGMEGGRAPIR
jgi:CheY-like chemotaxis protein